MNREDETKYLLHREDRHNLSRTLCDLERTLNRYRGVDLQTISIRERASYDALRKHEESLHSKLGYIGDTMSHYERKDSETWESDHD
ncbi:hypothetical protein EXS74_01385 [Candidatus Woesearchaeota archaeon]|nr:hypothetical protein [Candidatus Woesearchaeota archaeon]